MQKGASADDIQPSADFQLTRTAALKALGPIRPANPDRYFYGSRTAAGRKLPPYYLLYFLFVDLLRYPALGPQEKVAWSIPIDVEGQIYIVEHRKMGAGLFAEPKELKENHAARVVALIRKAVKAASSYFEARAEQAARGSNLNVLNRSALLYTRFEFFRDDYTRMYDQAKARADEQIVEEKVTEFGSSRTVTFPSLELREKARWLGQAAIDAFFSWTEHVLIHLAILQGKITTGLEVAELSAADWSSKFKKALDLHDPVTKKIFDELVLIRRQLRNYMAHGAFGKQGEAFRFHSDAGAVPVLLTERTAKHRFQFSGELDFEEASALDTISRFVDHLWSGSREAARLYLHETDLPSILTMAADGRYAAAMRSIEDMESLIAYLNYQSDQAANMDW